MYSSALPSFTKLLTCGHAARHRIPSGCPSPQEFSIVLSLYYKYFPELLLRSAAVPLSVFALIDPFFILP